MTTRRDNQKKSATATADERRQQERRAIAERRQKTEAVSAERREQPERRKVERRINEYRLEPAVLEFINAINEFKSVRQKPFPTWSEIFQIFHDLGYRKAED